MRADYPEDLPRTMGATVFVVYYLITCAHKAGLEPVSHTWLLEHMQQRTSPNTLTAALRWLTHQQYVLRIKHGWKLADGQAVQLPLAAGENDDENRALREKLIVVDVDSAYESDSLLSNNNNNNRENRAEREKLYFTNLEALRAEGIFGKKAEELARLDWVTPDYIRAAIDDSSTGDNPLGLAIYKMASHAPLDARQATRSEGITTAQLRKFYERNGLSPQEIEQRLNPSVEEPHEEES